MQRRQDPRLNSIGEGACEDTGGHPSHTRRLRGELQSLIRRGEVTARSVAGVHQVRGVIGVVTYCQKFPKSPRISPKSPKSSQIISSQHTITLLASFIVDIVALSLL